MNNEIADTPEDPRSHWDKPGNGPGQALEAFWESQRKLEDKLRNRFSKKHPDIPYHDIEAIVAMKMLEISETQPDTFFATLSGPPTEGGDSAQETETPQPADALDPTLLADMVKWRM